MVNTSKSAMSLTGNGLRDWLIQRISAVIIALYLFCVTGFFIRHSDMQYYDWVNYLSHPVMRIFGSIFLLAIILHAWIGMWTIATDYLKCIYMRMSFQIIMIIALLAYFIWGLQILWGL